MSTSILASRKDSNIPLSLSAMKGNLGGQAGLTVIVAIRDAATINSYLDFNDNTFKTVGWVQKTKTLADIGGGFYALSGGLNASIITNLPAATDHLVAEYVVSGGVKAVATDLIVLREALIRDIFNSDLDLFEVAAPDHSLLVALLKLISRFKINNGTGKAEIYQTDGVTLKAEQPFSTNAGQLPIVELGKAE